MIRLIITSLLTLGTVVYSQSQNISYTPEVVIGNRSSFYQHFINYNISNNWSINNVTLIDTEHKGDTNNIYFVRNMVSYKINTNLKLNAAVGVKKPGAFASITSQYQYKTSNFKISYSIGSTYQDGVTLEQNLLLNYTPKLSNNIYAYFNLFTVFNTNLKYLDRGIQQLRIGIKKENLILGIAANLDQFSKAKSTLENYGLFIKYNF